MARNKILRFDSTLETSDENGHTKSPVFLWLLVGFCTIGVVGAAVYLFVEVIRSYVPWLQ
jgi:hypothetical protein